MIRAVTLLALAVVLSGCDLLESAQVSLCKKAIYDRMRSPSSLKWVDTTVIGGLQNADVKLTVFLEYDAANAYGTLVRGKGRCVFEPDDLPWYKVTEVTVEGTELSQRELAMLNDSIEVGGKTGLIRRLDKSIDEAGKSLAAEKQPARTYTLEEAYETVTKQGARPVKTPAEKGPVKTP